MMRQRRAPRERRARRGVTLIEVIIAIIVMSIGVLGLAGTASYVAQQMGGGNAQTVAAAMSTKIADSLAARRCPSLVNGSQTSRGVTVTWTVTAASPARTATIDQTVEYKLKRGTTRTQTYRMTIDCPEFS